MNTDSKLFEAVKQTNGITAMKSECTEKWYPISLILQLRAIEILKFDHYQWSKHTE